MPFVKGDAKPPSSGIKLGSTQRRRLDKLLVDTIKGVIDDSAHLDPHQRTQIRLQLIQQLSPSLVNNKQLSVSQDAPPVVEQQATPVAHPVAERVAVREQGGFLYKWDNVSGQYVPLLDMYGAHQQPTGKRK